MRNLLMLITILLGTFGSLNAQSKLENSTFTIKYVGSDQTGNPDATLVDIIITIGVNDLNNLSKVYVSGGSTLGLSDKYAKAFILTDKDLINSNQIEFLDNNKVRIKLGYRDQTKEMVYFEIELEDTEGNIVTDLKRTF